VGHYPGYCAFPSNLPLPTVLWWEGGRRLVVISPACASKRCMARFDMPVELAMRYVSRSIESGLLCIACRALAWKEVLFMPQYPAVCRQYSDPTFHRCKHSACRRASTGHQADHSSVFHDNACYISMLGSQCQRRSPGEQVLITCCSDYLFVLVALTCARPDRQNPIV